MKNVILYFSGTGNSLEVAQYLEDHLDDSEAFHILKFDEDELLDGCETVGFVFPCYFTSVPDIVKKTIGELSLSKSAYYYSVVTYNGFLGNTPKQLESILTDKGCTLSYIKGIKMPGNYIVEYNGMVEAKAASKLEKARGLYSEVVDSIKSRKVVGINSSFALLSSLFYRFFTRRKAGWGKGFSVDDKCVGCGICKGVCSLKNIELVDGRPVWGDDCEHCVACIQWCPYHAIKYGEKTGKRRRYTNPAVDVTQMM